MRMVRLILLIGVPGSGKSTLAAQIQQSYPGQLLISTDAIREQLFGDQALQGDWQLVWREVQLQFQQAVAEIAQGRAESALYDATNARRRNRRQVIALARYSGFTQVAGLWLDTPLELCLERNRQRSRHVPEPVIQRMHRQLLGAPPTVAEGLDCLIHYA